MKRAFAVAGLMLMFSVVKLVAEEPDASLPSAAKLRAEGLRQAKENGKRVFLIFGSSGCGWCKVFEKYHADPEVGRTLDKHIVLVKVSTDENPGGEEMYLEYGKQRGVPAFSILDSDGKVLADSGGAGHNIGFPYERHEVEGYFTALRAACPRFSDDDEKLLRARLDEARPKKE